MHNIIQAKQIIRTTIAGSKIPEDPLHAENTLVWVLTLDPGADQALQIAALAHDIDRAVEDQKTKQSDYEDYDAFKAAHACNGAMMLALILKKCGLSAVIADEACRLVTLHEIGGDHRSDLLKDADGISFFEINMPLYCQREGPEETIRRCTWGYQRLSMQAKEVVMSITYGNKELTSLLKGVIQRGSN